MTDLSSPDEGHRILVILADPERVAASLSYAVAAALTPDTPILATHVGYRRVAPPVSAEEADMQELRDPDEGTPYDRMQKVRAAFDAWVSAAPPRRPVIWRDCVDDIEACIRTESRDCDLVLIGRPVHLDGRDALHAALFGAGRLVLVTPPVFAPGTSAIGRHILVGWKPGAHAARAVAAALPWLKRAERITVATVESVESERYRASAEETFTTLGLPFSHLGIQRGEERVGLALLRAVSESGADSLLIGAYRHGILWEAVLGGVTRDVLDQAKVPVFLMR